MAMVWLSRRDCEEGTLPALCLKCGRPASERVEKDLAGTLLWAAPVTFVLSAIGGGQSAKVRVPMCPNHRHYWRTRRLILLLAFLVALSPIAAALACYWLVAEETPDLDILGMLLNLGGCSAFILFLFVVIYGTAGIRATEIHESGIQLFGVSLKFAHTVESRQFLSGIDVDEALDPYSRRPRQRGKNVTDET